MEDSPKLWEPLLAHPASRKACLRLVCKTAKSFHDLNAEHLDAMGHGHARLAIKAQLLTQLTKPTCFPRLRSVRIDVPEGCVARVGEWAYCRHLHKLHLKLKDGAAATFDPPPPSDAENGGFNSLKELSIMGTGTAVYGLLNLREHLQELHIQINHSNLASYMVFMQEVSTFRQLRVLDSPTGMNSSHTLGVLLDPLPASLHTLSCLGLSKEAVADCAPNLTTLNVSLQQAKHVPWASLTNLTSVGLDATMYRGDWDSTHLGTGKLLGPVRHRITKLRIYGIGLFINHMSVTDMPQLLELTIKPELDLGIGNLSTLGVERCRRLEILRAECCGLMHAYICPLSCRSLDEVSLRGNLLFHLPAATLNRVRVLDLQGNIFLGTAVRALPGSYPRLVGLNLSHCGLQQFHLPSARALRFLDVSNNCLKTLHLGACPGLQVLRCNDNCLVELWTKCKLPCLKEVHLSGNEALAKKAQTILHQLLRGCRLPSS